MPNRDDSFAVGLTFGPVQPIGAVEQVVRRIGEAIGSGLLRSGQRLPAERRLAESFGVSTATLHQALAVLRAAGYIETHRGRHGGSFICADVDAVLGSFSRGAPRRTAGQLRDFTDWRRAVSGEASFLAAERAGPGEHARLQELAEEARACLGDFPAFRVADARLHVGISEAAGSQRLVSEETSIQAELTDVLRPVTGPIEADEASHLEHLMVLDAIYHGNGELARRAMFQHVEGTFDWYIGLLLGRLDEESS